MESNTVSEIVDVNMETDFAQNIKINTRLLLYRLFLL